MKIRKNKEVIGGKNLENPAWRPEVSDETGALLVYSSFITYKSFSPT